ncbi:MAG: hypothetical protein V4582_17645 [Pseudomonadota bacterium]
MQSAQHQVQPSRLQLLQECPLPSSAPYEIHGAHDLLGGPGEDYLFQGFRYVLDAARDVLIREDVDSWIGAHS